MFRNNHLPENIDSRREQARKWSLTPLPRAWTRPDRYPSRVVLFRHASATGWKRGDPAYSYPDWWNPEKEGSHQVRYNTRSSGSSTKALSSWLRDAGYTKELDDLAILHGVPFSRLAVYRMPVSEFGWRLSDDNAFFEPSAFPEPGSMDEAGAACTSRNIRDCRLPAGSEPDEIDEPQKLRKCSSLSMAQLLHAETYVFDTPHGSLDNRELCMIGHLVDSLERESFPRVAVFDGQVVREISIDTIRAAQEAWRAHDRFVWQHMFAAFNVFTRYGTFIDKKPDISSSYEGSMVPCEIHTSAWIVHACSPASLQVMIELPEQGEGDIINKYNLCEKDYARLSSKNLHFIKTVPDSLNKISFYWAGTGKYKPISGDTKDFYGARQSTYWLNSPTEDADGLRILRCLDALCALGVTELRSKTGWCLTPWGVRVVRGIKSLYDPDMLLRWRSGKMICTAEHMEEAEYWISERFLAIHHSENDNEDYASRRLLPQPYISSDKFRVLKRTPDPEPAKRNVVVLRHCSNQDKSSLTSPATWYSELPNTDYSFPKKTESVPAFLQGLIVRGCSHGMDECVVQELDIKSPMFEWAKYAWGKSDIAWTDLPIISDARWEEGNIFNRSMSSDLYLSETGEAISPTHFHLFTNDYKKYSMKPGMFILDMPEYPCTRILDTLGRYMEASGNTVKVAWFDGMVMRDIPMEDIDNARAEWKEHHRFMSSFHRNMTMIANRAYRYSLTKLDETLNRRYSGLESIECVCNPMAFQLLHLINDTTPAGGMSGGHHGTWYEGEATQAQIMTPGTSEPDAGTTYITWSGSGAYEPLIEGPYFTFDFVNTRTPESFVLMYLNNSGLVEFHKDIGWRTTPAGFTFLELLGPQTRDADVLLRWRKQDGRIGGPENAAAMDRWLVNFFRAVKRRVQHLPAS